MELSAASAAAGDGRLLVLFAVNAEAGPFRRRWARVAPSHSGTVEVVVTGMGAANAERGFLAALDQSGPCGRIFTCGFAGGLDPDLPAGTVVFDASEDFPGRARWVATGARPGRFHCAARVAVTPAEKAELRRQTGAAAVEMESGVIRRLAAERGISAATVRVISDAAAEALPLDFNATMTPDLRLSPARLAWQLVRSPGRIPELIRFGRSTAAAADRLAEFLVAALR